MTGAVKFRGVRAEMGNQWECNGIVNFCGIAVTKVARRGNVTGSIKTIGVLGLKAKSRGERELQLPSARACSSSSAILLLTQMWSIISNRITFICKAPSHNKVISLGHFASCRAGLDQVLANLVFPKSER